MANVGKLIVELAASTAQFQADMGKAAASADAASKRIGIAMSFAKGAVTGLAGAVSVASFVSLIRGTIDAADHLNDLSKSTGIAVETLGGIGFAAAQSGSNLDDAAASFGKLNLRIAAATAGNQDAVDLFKTIGISVKELKDSSPDQVFAKIADKFASYEDGANKAAIGNALFGKSYQGIIPLLDEGGRKLQENIDYFKKYGGVTTEVAQASDQFNDTVKKLQLLSGAFGRTLTAELLPGLQALTDELVKAKEKGDGFSTTGSIVADVLKGMASAAVFSAGAFVSLGRDLGAAAAQAVQYLEGNREAAKFIGEEANRELEGRLANAKRLVNAINNGPSTVPEFMKDTRGGPGPGKGAAPSLPGSGAGSIDDTAKRLLDQQLRALEAAIGSERDILKDREGFLQRYYQDDQIGIKDYFERRQGIILDALNNELAAYDKEIAALQRFAAKAAPKDRIEAETKIADVIAKRGKAQQDASTKGINLWLDEKKAADQFRSAIEDIGIALAAMNGDSVGAGIAAFDKAKADIKSRATLQAQSSDDAEAREGALALQLIAATRARTVEQLQLNKAQEDFGNILAEVGIAQDRLSIARDSGAITELDYLAKVGDANKARISDLQRVADAYAAVAAASGDKRALIISEQLKVKIESLAAAGDLVAKKFNDIFINSFADAFASVVDGTKSVKDAFRDMERSIVQSISRIAAQNIAESIFGKGGATGGGIGDIFAKLFGLLGGAGGQGYGTIGSAIPSGPFPYANGTNFAAGGMSLVGERGPELVNLPRGSQVIPNHKLGGNVINITQHFSGQTSTQSARQAAVMAGDHVSRALRRR